MWISILWEWFSADLIGHTIWFSSLDLKDRKLSVNVVFTQSLPSIYTVLYCSKEVEKLFGCHKFLCCIEINSKTFEKFWCKKLLTAVAHFMNCVVHFLIPVMLAAVVYFLKKYHLCVSFRMSINFVIVSCWLIRIITTVN